MGGLGGLFETGSIILGGGLVCSWAKVEVEWAG